MLSNSQIFFFISHTWGVFAVALLILGSICAMKGRFALHRSAMTLLVAGGWSFVFFYLYMSFSSERSYSVEGGLVVWLALHGSLALFTLLGATVLVWARLSAPSGPAAPPDRMALRDSINARHRLFGRVLALLWLFTHVSGILNLYLF